MASDTLSSWGKVAQKIRVPAGTLIGVVFLFLMHPSRRSLWIGAFVTLSGAALRVWAAGHIEKGRVLARCGPYARTRNPLYLGSFLMALGILLAGQGYWLLVPFFAFYASVYYPVMKAEEQELLNGHGNAFLDYSRSVPLFFPSLTARSGSSSEFLWARVIKNREHRNLAGLLVAELFLVLRWLYPSSGF
jgi:protein-S-isoprenylcysteine O-methyltransferase Ste14